MAPDVQMGRWRHRRLIAAAGVVCAALIGGAGGVPAAQAATRMCTALTTGGTCEFGPSSSPVLWTVPAGVTQVLVNLTGGGGAATTGAGQGAPGPGGMVVAQLNVSPGQQYELYIGAQGQGRQRRQRVLQPRRGRRRRWL